jgi:signal transduction histidine kinase
MDAKETSFFTAVLIISVILGIILTYFVISIIRHHRRSLKLYRKSIFTEINTLEKERRRIAADLHDEIGPVLSALKLKIASFDLTDHDDIQEAKKTTGQIDDIIQRMREVSFDLMPNTLVRKGFIMALREFIEYCNKGNHSMKIFFLAGDDLVLEEKQSINLYRIAQEVIHNALKHSKASELRLEIRKEKKNIVFASSDNGIGFNYGNSLSESKGMGLGTLLSRTEIMGGKMYIESKRDKGTTYIFDIPIHND